MYDPSAGRWLEEDPIGFAAEDANLYRYVGNTPTNSIDPTGLDNSTGRMVLDLSRSQMLKALELDGLREKFPGEFEKVLDPRNIRALQQSGIARQTDVENAEKKLGQLKTLREAHAGNGNITKLIDKQIALQNQMISLRKEELERVLRKCAIANNVNGLDKKAKDYDRMRVEYELEFLRLMQNDVRFLDKLSRLQEELHKASDAVYDALKPK